MIKLANNWLSVETDAIGASLRQIHGVRTGIDYLPAKPLTPAFPYVDKLNIRNPHLRGYVADNPVGGLMAGEEFDVVESTPHSVTYRLDSHKELHDKYPHPFRLEVSYKLRAYHVNVSYKIINTGLERLPFEIGCNWWFKFPPAYWLIAPKFWLNLKMLSPIAVLPVNDDGYAFKRRTSVHLINGRIEVSPEQTSKADYYFGSNGVKQISVIDSMGRAYLSVASLCPYYHFAVNLRDGVDYMRLQPQWGIGDSIDTDEFFRERPNARTVLPGRSMTFDNVLTLNAESTYFSGRPGSRRKGTPRGF